MRGTGIAALFLAVMVLAGCNARQKTEVAAKTEQAKAGIKQAAHQTKQSWSDSSIMLKVKTAMGSSDKLKTTGIDVTTKDKVVTLSGTVPDAQQKALAERIAK